LNIKRWVYFFIAGLLLSLAGVWGYKKMNINAHFSVGQKMDSLNAVYVYYNGSVDNTIGRNTTKDGYNLGVKYQCVEFVKRYYYQHLKHKMPDSYGNAKDFFDKALSDGQKNHKRNLTQHTNPSYTKPKVDDLLIYNGTLLNKYGHVSIVSKVTDNEIEIIQQNAGRYSKARETFALVHKDGKWVIKNKRIMGWLRK
jgi:surface antigen